MKQKYLDSSSSGDYGRRAKHKSTGALPPHLQMQPQKVCLQIARIITLKRGGIPSSCDGRRVERAKDLLISPDAGQANESMYDDKSQLPDNSTNKLIIETCIFKPRQLQCALAHVHCMQQEADGRRKVSRRAPPKGCSGRSWLWLSFILACFFPQPFCGRWRWARAPKLQNSLKRTAKTHYTSQAYVRCIYSFSSLILKSARSRTYR